MHAYALGAAIAALLVLVVLVAARRARQQRMSAPRGGATSGAARRVAVPPSGDPDFPAGSPIRWVCDPEHHECTPALWRAAGEPSWATQSECLLRGGRETLAERARRMARPDAEDVYPYGRNENGAPPTPPTAGARAAWYVSAASPALTGDAIEDVSAVLRPGAAAEYGAVDEMAAYE